MNNYCGESQITVTNFIEDAWLFWRFNGEIDSTQNESITVTQSGEYSIFQKQGNCASQDSTIIINLTALPTPPVGSDKEICATEPIQPLTAEVNTSGSDIAVKWFDNATDGNEILSPVLNTVGTITYYAEAINNITGCTSESRIPVTLTIKPNPKSTILDTTIVGKPNSNVAVLIFPKDSLKYQWFLNNDEISNATNQYYYIAEADRKNENTFTVEVELLNGCKAKFNYPYNSSIDNEINAFKSSELTNFERLFTIYPNPVDDNLNIAVNSKNIDDDAVLIAKIYSIDGTLVLTAPLDQNPKNIDMKYLPPGFYSIVILNNQNRLTTEKLVVTKH